MLNEILAFFDSTQSILEKSTLADQFVKKFNAIKVRSIYDVPNNIASVRFSQSKTASDHISNTVISLKAIMPRDDHPVLSVLVTPGANYIKLMNSTFINKLSHSSQALTVNNVVGSINYSDILKSFEGIPNDSHHVYPLFELHSEHTFQENLVRIVEQTNNIVAVKERFTPTVAQERNLFLSPERSLLFFDSKDYSILESDLKSRVRRNTYAIAIAGLIPNVNLRGRIIEKLITSDDPEQISSIVSELYTGETPTITTADKLSDYDRLFGEIQTGTDIKTKVMYLTSAPKAFSVDDMLSYLSEPNTVFLFFFIGIEKDQTLSLRLLPLFESNLLSGIHIQNHWSGRMQRGHGQFDGHFLHEMLEDSSYNVIPVSNKEGHEVLSYWLSLGSN